MGLENVASLGRFGEPSDTYSEMIPEFPVDNNKKVLTRIQDGISDINSCQLSPIYLVIRGIVTRSRSQSEK